MVCLDAAAVVCGTAYFSCRGEMLKRKQYLGTFQILLGTIGIAFLMPQDKAFTSVQEMIEKLQEPVFWSTPMYTILWSPVVFIFVGFIFFFRRTPIWVYPFTCSLLEVLPVPFSKALGIILKSGVYDSAFLKLVHMMTWVVILVLFFVNLGQEIYLNKSLDLYGPQKIRPIHFMLSTSTNMYTLVFLFPESNSMPTYNVGGVIISFMGIVLGMFLLN